MAHRGRNNPDWQALITEHQILKRKLQSKSEALLIISKDLDTAHNERDQFKLMGEKLQQKCQAFKRQQVDFPLSADQSKLIQMLKDVRNQKAAYQRQNEILQQRLTEAHGDVKLLREKFARQTIGDEGIGARHFPLHERQKLVTQLEESQQQCEHWKKEYESQLEVANEAIADRDGARSKADRLNQELSYVLLGDKKRIVDIDALCMENKYLQERITQCQAEKNTLHAQIKKLKSLLTSKKSSQRELPKVGALQSSGGIISPKQIKELLARGMNRNSPEQVADLQSIVAASLETLSDKNLAIHHLRNTNKILGKRVSDLERKLKTYETGGLWNMPANDSSGMQYSFEDLFPDYNADEEVLDIGELKNTSHNLEGSSNPEEDDLNDVEDVPEDNIIQHHISVESQVPEHSNPEKQHPPSRDKLVSVSSGQSTECSGTEEIENLSFSSQEESKPTDISNWLEPSSLDEAIQLEDCDKAEVVRVPRNCSSMGDGDVDLYSNSSQKAKENNDEKWSFANANQA